MIVILFRIVTPKTYEMYNTYSPVRRAGALIRSIGKLQKSFLLLSGEPHTYTYRLNKVRLDKPYSIVIAFSAQRHVLYTTVPVLNPSTTQPIATAFFRSFVLHYTRRPICQSKSIYTVLNRNKVTAVIRRHVRVNQTSVVCYVNNCGVFGIHGAPPFLYDVYRIYVYRSVARETPCTAG